MRSKNQRNLLVGAALWALGGIAIYNIAFSGCKKDDVSEAPAKKAVEAPVEPQKRVEFRDLNNDSLEDLIIEGRAYIHLRGENYDYYAYNLRQ